MAERSTYVRKIGDRQYEYGILERSKNFRKRPDKYIVAGVEASVASAEAARAMLVVDAPAMRECK